MKKILTLLLAFGLLNSAVPVLAAEKPLAEPVPAWAYGEVADIYAMGLVGDEIYTGHSKPVTQEQLDRITRVTADKLALLGVPANPMKNDVLVIDTTRHGVINALYQEAETYLFDGIDHVGHYDFKEGAVLDYMESLGVVHGDGTDMAQTRPCTLLEAACFAERLILALYDQQNTGSLGLLWKAEGNGNTLYLLGSIHTDRNNVYPIHRQLRDIITGAEQVAFELDFNDQAGIDEFAAMQTYSDGTTLKDHISPALYQAVVDITAQLGMTEEVTAACKPWALANAFTSLSMLDETSGENAMAIDLYVNAKAANVGIPSVGVETYAFQGGIFDSLEEDYQEAYLAGTLLMLVGGDELDDNVKAAIVDVLGPEALEDEVQTAIGDELAAAGEWMDCWKSRDVDGFARSYPKDEIIGNSEDPVSSRLFTDRDPNMIAWADGYLKQSGSHTGLMTVGAGHMIGKTGIVQGLKDLGYTVEVVPAP